MGLLAHTVPVSYTHLVILVIITAGCTKTEAPPAAGTAMSDEDQEEITLRVSWWGPEARHEATLKAMERYMELHSNITLVGEYSDWNGHYDKLVTDVYKRQDQRHRRRGEK